MFNSIGRSSNFARAGKSAADDLVRSFAAQRRASPDYGGLAQTAANIRSDENSARLKAATDVAKAGVKAAAGVEATRIKYDADTTKKKAQRKAGALATGGKMIGAAGIYYGDSKDRKLRDTSDSAYENPLKQSAEDALATANKNLETFESGINPETGKSYGRPLGASNDSTPSTSNTSTGSSAPKASVTAGGSGQTTAMRLMTDLTNDGYTPTQAAAIVGNAQHESANFTAHEEFAPNAYGTKGAGFFQWTNAGGSNRRDSFEGYAKQHGLDPKSYAANTGYMLHEMKGNAGNHWTGGMNDDSFRQIGDLSTAVTSFQDNYLRPNKQYAHTDARMSYAQQALAEWQKLNS